MVRKMLKKISVFDWPSSTPQQCTFKNKQLDQFPHLEEINVNIKGRRNLYEISEMISKNRSLTELNISFKKGGTVNKIREEDSLAMDQAYTPCNYVQRLNMNDI